MKSFYTIAFVVAFIFQALSQSATYGDFTARYFHGIKTQDGKLFYTAYYGEPRPDTPYNMVIHIFNSELKRVIKERVDVKYNSGIADIISHNGGLLVYINSGEDGLIYYYDSEGKKVWNKKLVRDKSKFNEAKMLSLGGQGFAVIRPDKEKSNGFRVTLYDDQLNEKWSVAQYPEKGNLEAHDVKVAGDKIAILSHFQKSVFSSKYEEKIHVFSAADGKEIYQQLIVNEENNGIPQRMKVNPDGSTFIIGYYTSRDVVATDLFYKGYSADGKLLFDQKFSQKDELTSRLLTDRATKYFGFTEAPIILVEDIKKTDAGYEVLGEAFKYVFQPAPTTAGGTTVNVNVASPGKLYVMDYVILKISNTGKLEDVKKIAKPYKRISAEGHPVTNELYAGKYYRDFDLFAYRFLDSKNDKSSIVSLNWNHNMPYVGYTSVAANHDNILNRTYLKKAVSEINSGVVTDYFFKKEGVEKPLQNYSYNFLPYHKEGKMLHYEYEGGELLMEVVDMEPSNAAPSNGELALSGIPGSQFKGVTPIEGQGYYTFYRSEEGENSTGLYVYHRLDQQLNTLGRSVLVVPTSAYFAGNVANGGDQVMVFQDREHREWYFYNIDANGRLTAQNKISLANTSDQLPIGNLLLEPAPDGFYMVQPYVDTAKETNGFQVMRLNSERQLRWKWAHEAGGEEVLQLISTEGSNGVFAVVYNQFHFTDFNKVSNTLVALNDGTGDKLMEYNFFDGQDGAFPEYIKVEKDQSIVASGMYFKGAVFNATNSTGLFVMKLGADGTQKFYNKTPWEKVEAQLQLSEVQGFLISGKVKVLIEDMILMPDGKYKVIGEMFRKSTGTTGWGFALGDDLGDRAFSIYDFIVFDYGKSGDLGGVYRIPKDEQNIEVPRGLGQQRGLALSLIMRTYNMFSYLKVINEEEKPELVYTNTVKGEKRVYKAPVDKAHATSVVSSPATYVYKPADPDKMNAFEMLDSKLQKLGNDMEKAISGTDQTFNFFRDPYRGFAMSSPTDVLVYFYNPENKTLNLKLEPLK